MLICAMALVLASCASGSAGRAAPEQAGPIAFTIVDARPSPAEGHALEAVHDVLAAEFETHGYVLGQGDPRVEVRIVDFNGRAGRGFVFRKAEAEVRLTLVVLAPDGTLLHEHRLNNRAYRPIGRGDVDAVLDDAVTSGFDALFANPDFTGALAGRAS